jgi:hypothetical protein
VRVHTYVIRWDAGSAPNYDPPFITLAVCKPRIRKKAEVGDLVLAFAGKPVNPLEPHTVVWAGIVAEKMSFSDYWDDRRFAGKKPDRSDHSDNFYRPVNGGLLWVENEVHGPEETNKDTGGLFVLGFSPSWRFGANGPAMPTEFGLRIVNGRRGERVSELSGPESKRLKSWLDGHFHVADSQRKPAARCSPRKKLRKVVAVQRRVSRC